MRDSLIDPLLSFVNARSLGEIGSDLAKEGNYPIYPKSARSNTGRINFCVRRASCTSERSFLCSFEGRGSVGQLSTLRMPRTYTARWHVLGISIPRRLDYLSKQTLRSSNHSVMIHAGPRRRCRRSQSIRCEKCIFLSKRGQKISFLKHSNSSFDNAYRASHAYETPTDTSVSRLPPFSGSAQTATTKG